MLPYLQYDWRFPLFILIGRGPPSPLQYIQLQGALFSLQYDQLALAAASLSTIRLIGWRFLIFNLIGRGSASPLANMIGRRNDPIPHLFEEEFLFLQFRWLC
jgi:hypothetical protein